MPVNSPAAIIIELSCNCPVSAPHSVARLYSDHSRKPPFADGTMKALSIQQPWVHAILCEGKDIENRSWQRNFRGWLAIHASAKPRRDARFPRGITVPDLGTLDYSAICGVARLVDIIPKSRSKWFYRPDDGTINFGWVLADITALKTPIPCKGALGLWELPPQVVRAIRRQLPKLRFDEWTIWAHPGNAYLS